VELTELRLACFRSYRELRFAPPQAKVVLIGDNGQGKTNLLEAIHFLSIGRSFRTAASAACVMFGEQAAEVAASYRRRAGSVQELKLRLPRRGERKVWHNGLPCERFRDVLGELNTIVFSALDISLVAGQPALRRRHLNEELSKLSPRYFDELARYRRVLAQRNQLLRRAAPGPAPPHLETFTAELVDVGLWLVAARERFVAQLKPHFAQVAQALGAGEEDLALDYRSTLPPAREDALRRFAEVRALELARGTTLLGPHRDDLQLTIRGKPLRQFGSRGQQKTAALALKLAQASLAMEIAREPPILLFDDVLPELDMDRRTRLVALAERFGQAFFTATSESDVPPQLLKRGAVFRVHQSTLAPWGES